MFDMCMTFKYFFYHVLDLNTDHVISEEDFDRLNEVHNLTLFVVCYLFLGACVMSKHFS